MKKIFALLLVVACFILTACGGPTPKEEAIKLNNSYVKQSNDIFNSTISDMDSIVDKSAQSNESLYKFAAVTRGKNLQAINDLIAKYDKEQVADPAVKEMTRKRLVATQRIIELYSTLDKEKELNLQERFNFQTDYNNKMRQSGDDILVYNNEYSKLVNGTGTYKLTLDNFKKIHKGDGYNQVANYFGMPGKLISTDNISLGIISVTRETFEWKNGETVVTITFNNDKAEQISQKNLQ